MKCRKVPGRMLLLVLALGLTLAGICLTFDADLYRDCLVKVTETETVSQGKTTGENGVAEETDCQQVTAVVLNGEEKGKTVTFQNEYTRSEVKSTCYRAGDWLFASLKGYGENAGVSVISVKRDTWLVGIAGLFLCLLCFFYEGQGGLILLSLMVNVGMMAAAFRFCDTDRFFDRQWLWLVAAFCVITLLAVGGFHRQTLGTICSTLTAALILLALYQLTINRSSVVPYDMMEDTLGSAPIENIFRFSVIAGSIGAIMDVAVAMHTAMEQLRGPGTPVTLRTALHSMRTIGSDLMGTMLNVLFFSYISQSLPITILKITSGYSLSAIFSYDLIFDFVRFLLGAIAIVLTIPISEGFALLFARLDGRCAG